MVPPTDSFAAPAPGVDTGREPDFFSAQVSQARRFFLDLAPAPDCELTVVSAGCEHCRQDYEINRTSFPYPVIEFVARGQGHLWLDGKEYLLLPGTVFAYGADMAHRMRSDERDLLVKYFCDFTGAGALELMNQCRVGLGQVVRVPNPEQVQQVFDDLIAHGRSDCANRTRLCTVALQYLLMKIGDVAIPYGETSSRAFSTYQQCRRYIEEHYTELHSLGEVAEACNVDLSYLCRLFQRFGRERPKRYLQHLRLNRAAELLQNTGRPVKEVADELGFNDPFNFSRAFQRAFGMPPGRVRQLARKKAACEP